MRNKKKTNEKKKVNKQTKQNKSKNKKENEKKTNAQPNTKKKLKQNKHKHKIVNHNTQPIHEDLQSDKMYNMNSTKGGVELANTLHCVHSYISICEPPLHHKNK